VDGFGTLAVPAFAGLDLLVYPRGNQGSARQAELGRTRASGVLPIRRTVKVRLGHGIAVCIKVYPPWLVCGRHSCRERVMLEELMRGKKYRVVKAWSEDVALPWRLKQMRYELKVGEVLRFRGPNFTGVELLDIDGKLVILPKKVAFRILAPPES
jgi:hypothetical protein